MAHPEPDPILQPVPHRPRREDIASRAWAAAQEMAGEDTDRAGGPERPAGELVAAALKAHRTLSRGLGQSVPVTPLGPDGGGVRGLAAFVAVYAAEQEQREEGGLGAAA
ncbi:hypothetical protein [Streptomyces sp. NPDC046909]|uniref:hypothetical protein n=1 Tax=Streptomyces sp. NPDC046909 TaxID=3155617 RepID=UPI0033DC0C28